MNDLYNMYNSMFGNNVPKQQPRANRMSIMDQYRMVSQNPGSILDIMLQNGRISQQQYQDMQPIKNNPQAIVQYLMNNGYANEINNAKQQINN